ncbi:hypothetical protein CEXT_457021 [Caerostris extrusa]|uniref:Uncharacterized protein n=1 Tax=Caerostris extrusa TaxID=172846 RepID=A0AAV4UB92_CAEEX|nr:hypothetical protein CEXT_457021 [Caerostris extrusa]
MEGWMEESLSKGTWMDGWKGSITLKRDINGWKGRVTLELGMDGWKGRYMDDQQRNLDDWKGSVTYRKEHGLMERKCDSQKGHVWLEWKRYSQIWTWIDGKEVRLQRGMDGWKGSTAFQQRDMDGRNGNVTLKRDMDGWKGSRTLQQRDMDGWSKKTRGNTRRSTFVTTANYLHFWDEVFQIGTDI